jgi:tripeptide aminopeptidase
MKNGIDEKRLVRTFLDLVEIDGVTFAERPVAEFVKNYFSDLHLPVEEDDAAESIGGDCGNLLVRIPGNNPSAKTMIIASHLDTILPTEKLNVVEKDGVYYSDGTTILGADDRAGVAVMLECARTLVEEGGSPRPLEFLFTVAEEKGLFGAKALQKGWLKGEYLYVLDSDGPVGRIVNGAPYGVKLAVTVKGRSAHAGIDPESGVSAVVIASRAIAAMKLGRIDEITTANIGTITGGQAQNIIPDMVDVVGEVRSIEEDRLIRQVVHMENCFKSAAAEAGGEVVFYSHPDYSGYYFPQDSPEIELVRRALARLGLETVMESSCGASDANITTGLGIPSLVLSVGYLKPHTTQESIPRKELVKAGELVYEMVRNNSSIIPD